MFSYLSYISGREGKKWVILGRRRRSTKLGERKWVASFKGIQISGYNCGTKQCNRNVLLWENKHLLQRKYIIALLLPYKMTVLNPSLSISYDFVYILRHSLASFAPASDEVPDPQSLHVALPCSSWYWPATHGLHSPLLENVPRGQSAAGKIIENFVKAFQREPEARIWEDLLIRL